MGTENHGAEGEAVSAASVGRTIEESLRSLGGKYAGWRCLRVSWDDVSRGNIGGALSKWGANITDTYLKSKNQEALYTIRSENWNERLGCVSADDVTIRAVNYAAGETSAKPIRLCDFLEKCSDFGGYAGLRTQDLSQPELDDRVSIRFQSVFLPVAGDDEKGTVEFATEAYNYNTLKDEDPRNLLLLCTSQGLAVQQDGAGAKKLYLHAVNGDRVTEHWLEAERSKNRIGGPQIESEEDKASAADRGKATAEALGIHSMGQRFNVLMTIQIPLKQQDTPVRDSCDFMQGACCPEEEECEFEDECEEECDEECGSVPPTTVNGSVRPGKPAKTCSAPRKIKLGKANAARVSKGSEVSSRSWTGLSVSHPVRATEHVTVTVVIYNTVAGGVPSTADVIAAIDDLDSLYASCSVSNTLSSKDFDFMKKELTVKDAVDIGKKILSQPL